MKVAVIGSGISGLSSAYYLSKKHKVDLFEKQDRFGGHSYTLDVEYDFKEKVSVDVGFMVFNKITYPNLISFFEENKIEIEKSDMSFSVNVKNTNIEYCGKGLNGIFSNRSNLFNYKFVKMFFEIINFYKGCENLDANSLEDNITLGQYLEKIKIHDGSASIIDSSEEENLAVRFYFQINIKSIKSTSMLKWIDLDLETLEELEFPSDIELEDEKIKNKKDDPRIDLCFSKATQILDRDIKPLTAKYVGFYGDNLKRDIESLEISHEKRIKEIKNDISHQKRKLKEIDRKIMNARSYSTERKYVDQRDKQ